MSDAQQLHGDPARDCSPWVRRFLPLIGPGVVLDLACGGGRHSHLLLDAGHAVLALDRDEAAFPALAARGARTLRHDLEAGATGYDWPFAPASFAAIVVCNYLHRPLFPALLESLADGGLLIMETFAQGNAAFGRPANPAYLLQNAELLAQMHSNPRCAMHVIAFEDGYAATPRPAMLQRICARRAAGASANDRL